MTNYLNHRQGKAQLMESIHNESVIVIKKSWGLKL